MNDELKRIGDDFWASTLESSPTNATLLGYHDHDTELEDLSREVEDEHIASLDGLAAAAEAIDPDSLTADERISREVLMFEASTAADELRSRMAEFAVDPFNGIQVVFQLVAGQIPITEPEHAEAMVEKWSKMGRLLDQAIGRLRQGVARDRTPPVVGTEKTIAQLDTYLASPVETDALVNLAAPPQWSEDEVAEWRGTLSDQVRSAVRPGFARYRDAIVDEILPVARPQERSGIVWLEDGQEVYERAIRRHTSLPLTALDIHNAGLGDIAELDDEYRRLGKSVLDTDDRAAIYGRLRDDKALRFEDADQIVAAAQGALDRARAAMGTAFGRLPKAPCVLAVVPPLGAEDAPLAFYFPPTEDGSRPGTFFVNTTFPTTRTRYESEALAFHESIPGHHLQLALSQEAEGLPDFRKNAFITVFHEGWGLYSERLADEMGLYTGDLERLGILSFDSWRAGRLVVDTGLHALGWSRQQAIDYLTSNSPQAPNNIVNEVERYIAWPGQALAYKTGQRQMLQARAGAEKALGRDFDISAFHDTLLGSGSVPMPTMHRLIDEWVAGQ
ncbi:MAG: hypothetical protein BMS9Abin07_0148 [Acidimicrobiia bacterium]|nr:MAG: hypothetical protein BMS9Abin07_0148 [Acidimicrobiia bacterium]